MYRCTSDLYYFVEMRTRNSNTKKKYWHTVWARDANLQQVREDSARVEMIFVLDNTYQKGVDTQPEEIIAQEK